MTPGGGGHLEPGRRAAAAGHPRAREGRAAAGSWTRPTGTGSQTGAAGNAGPALPLPEPLPDEGLAGLLVRFAAVGVPVARRDIAAYDELFAVPTGGAR